MLQKRDMELEVDLAPAGPKMTGAQPMPWLQPETRKQNTQLSSAQPPAQKKPGDF